MLRVRLIAVTAIMLLMSSLLFAPSALAYACGSLFQYRGYDFASGVSNAKGVRGNMSLPTSSQITGLARGRAMSAGDVYLINGHDFVQVGWYVGETGTGLPYTSSPRYWVGEYNPNAPGNEVLRAGVNLAWGSDHTVKISFTSADDGSYDFYLDGNYQFATQRTHFVKGQAAFNGEIDFACLRMYAVAKDTSAPLQTLQYQTFNSSGSHWTYFSDVRGIQTTNGVTIVSTNAGDNSTDFAYGGGS